jgi:hypothetical protein
VPAVANQPVASPAHLGVIRSKGYVLPSTLDAVVEKLVSEKEAARGRESPRQ